MRFIARLSCFCIGRFSSCCLVKHKYANNNSFCSLGAISIESRSIVFLRNVEKVILSARFLFPFVVVLMLLNIKALVRFVCVLYRLWLKNYFKKVLE